jgi:nucleotide-binding universal stress UspA family protein
MLGWKRIGCAVDLSEPSRRAMEVAADLAACCGAELSLALVVPPPTPSASDVLVSSKGVAAAATEEAEETLAKWSADAGRRAGMPVRGVLLRGEPAAELARAATEQEWDVLVVATHGRTGVRRLVLGSVAERIVRHAPCPVLVARERVEQDGAAAGSPS